MPRSPALSRSDLRRLERLARQAGTTPARVLKAVLRDGFDYTEWFVRRIKEGEADLKAGRVFSTTDLLTRSRANPRRLRAAHAAIESDIARRRPPAIRKVVLKPQAAGPVAIWDGVPRRTSVDHDSVHDEP